VKIAPILVGALAGAFWAASYPLSALSAGAVVAAHLLGGAALALVLPPLLRRFAPRAPAAAAALTSFLLLFALPALLSELPVAALGRAPRAAVILAGGGLLLLLGILAGRAGWVASAITGAALLAPLALLGHQSAEVLPSRPTVVVQRSDSIPRRLVVIGLDGADWRVIDPLLEAGELPNLARLAETGVAGILESIEPTFSPVVWSSIFSGTCLSTSLSS